MSLIVAVPCALASAAAYGAATAAQHSAMGEHQDRGGTGRTSLGRLLRSPRWLLGLGGDGLGMILQVVALATGPVVVVQPLQVLALPISLPIAWALGGRRPSRRDYLACIWIALGLLVFFLLIGRPGDARPPELRGVLLAVGIAVVAGGVLLALSLRARPSLKALSFGGVAGAWFGLVAVLIDASAAVWVRDGIAGFGRPDGFVPLIVLIALGAVSIWLTQLAFQAGPLTAGFPANLAADPVVAVGLGAVLVHETIPLSPAHLLGYAFALSVIVFGTIRLAAEPVSPEPDS